MSEGASPFKLATWIVSRCARISSTFGSSSRCADEPARQSTPAPCHRSHAAKFALKFVEDVDRTGFCAGELHRLSDDGGEHGLKIERLEFPKLRALRPSTRDMWTFGRRYSALTTPSWTTNTITFRAAERTGARRMTDGSWFSIQSLIAVHLSLTSCVRGKYPEIDYSC
jgi:hypothetical protein